MSESFILLLSLADSAAWTVRGISVQLGGTRTFVDPRLTWPAFEAIAERLGFSVNAFVHVVAREA